ncbi:MAG: sulfatase [Chloroflexi bacterium]|nr:sulfatase [Chloroflexota bacterium]
MRILLLDLDTLRPDHLGCYGYHRNTSPNIDAVARQGVRFDNYYCSDAPCLPSRAALMSGRFGIHTGVVGHGGTAADMRLEGEPRGFRDTLAHSSLPAMLRTAGLRTVLVSPFGERHSAWWFYAGYTEMYNTGKGGMESAEDVTPAVLDWIKRNAQADDWFLHVNYWDPHTPYRAPEAFGNPFAHDPLPAWLTEETLAHHRAMVGPHTAREVNMFDSHTSPQYPRHPGELATMADLRRMIDGYDCGIRYMDSHIGQLFDALAAQGVLDDLAIIISADHAENLGELGIYGEHATADQGTCHIPMIIRWPGKAVGVSDNGLHYNLDLAPTLAELLGQATGPRWDGRSYAQALAVGAGNRAGDRAGTQQGGHDELVLSQCAHVCQRSVRFDHWLYMRTYHDGFHLFPQEMLFDLSRDLYQEHDVAGEQQAVCRDAVYRLNAWHDTMMAQMPYDVDPLWTVIKEGGPLHARGRLREYCARLEQTGRGWAVPELTRRHPREFA